MKRLTLSVMLVVAVVANTFACTNLIVGKKCIYGRFYNCFLFCRLLWIVWRVVSLSRRHAQERHID